MKYLKTLVVVFMSLFIVTGCNKNEISIDIFKSVSDKYNYSYTSIKDKYDYVMDAYYIYQDGIHIELVKTKKSDDAKGLYVDEYTNIYNAVGDDLEDSLEDGTNWVRLSVSSSDRYFYLILIDRTYMYVEAPLDKKEEVINYINEIV